MYPNDIDPITYSREDAQKARRLRLYDVRWLATWGPIGRRQVRHLQRDGWEHAGSLQTGLIRREHCLLRVSTEGGDR